MTPERTYLGDGLYAEFDGHGIWLIAPQFAGTDHRVYLEPEVFQALLRFAAVHWNIEKREEPG